MASTDVQLISADSHVVEAPEVFAGLVERFGNDAPRIATMDGAVDAMVIPACGRCRQASWESRDIGWRLAAL